jgi:hypothetical protein
MITHTNTSRYPREASGGTSDGAGSSKVGYNNSQVEVIQQYRAFLLFKMSLLPRFNLVGNKYIRYVYILNNIFYVQNLPKCKT